MKTKVVAFLLLLAPLLVLAGDAPVISRVGRVALAVNDQASFGTVGGAFDAMVTRSIPVVLDMTKQTEPVIITPVVSVYRVYADMRANKSLSERLYAAAQDFQFKRVMVDQIKAILAGTPATIIDSPDINAILTRTAINLPVKFVSNEIGSVEKPGVSKSKNYSKWEQTVVEELRKSNAADTLLVSNVLLWGIRMGGTKCEGQTGGAAAWRVITTNNLGNAGNKSCAVTLLNVNNRLINVADGKTIAEFNSSYVVEGGSTEQYIADSAVAFERDSTCLVKWCAENLKRVMSVE